MNKYRAERSISSFGGKPRTFILNMNAIVEFEEAIGEGVLGGSTQELVMSFRWQRALAWACLLKDPDHPTIEQVGDWLEEEMTDPQNFQVVLRTLGEVYGAFWPEVKKPNGEDDSKNALRLENGTGSESSNSPAALV